MKIYTGTRGYQEHEILSRDEHRGEARAYVDGKPLAPRLDLANHSPTGFEWGYGGSGPAQLALALLVDVLGNEHDALGWYQYFKVAVVCGLPHDEWKLTEDEIKSKVDELRRSRPEQAARIEADRASFNFSHHIKGCLQCHRAELGEAPEMCAAGKELFETWEAGTRKAVQ